MQFHHDGYVSGDPRILPAAGAGIDRPEELPDQVDVLVVGSGPAGIITAAQLSQFPSVTTRIIEKRAGRLEMGHADGVSVRSVETFEAFGFGRRIVEEAYQITQTAFWKPNPANPSEIIRTARTEDDPTGLSEFEHITVNQARVADYFIEFMGNSPTKMKVDYGIEFLGLTVDEGQEYPVLVQLRHSDSPLEGTERAIRAKFVVGADGARSAVRASIGRTLEGDQAMHAWGVMDALVVTDFPDYRTKAAIQSGKGGNILWIPREGGYLTRIYVDLGEVPDDDHGAVRQTPLQSVIDKANEILHPYRIDVRNVPWHSVYEVGHRVTDKFDNVPAELTGSHCPRVFIAGDACHTHSAKAGQGMNVSMQDGLNIGWKLGYVLDGRSPESLLDTYSAERQAIARNLIDFDKQWSTLMAKRPEELEDPTEVERFYVGTWEFPAGMATQYPPAMLVGDQAHQSLAIGFPVGRRFKSYHVKQVCDGRRRHLGHLHKADGRWRIYVFADAAAPGPGSATESFAEWLASAPDSPVVAHTPEGADVDTYFDVKVIYQRDHTEIELSQVPAAFRPVSGPFELVNWEQALAVDPEQDIFEARGIDRGGAVVVVRPDMYVSQVLPLSATDELTAFFRPVFLARKAVVVGS